MRITVTAIGGAGPVDLDVDCPDSTLAGELLAHVAEAAGASAGSSVLVDGVRVDLAAAAGAVIRHGSVVEFGAVEPPRTSRPLLALHAVGGIGAGRSWPLAPGAHGVGRDDDVAIQLPGAAVSRRHAELRVDAAGTTLIDRGSTNGIWRDAERITATPLRPGDVARLGGTALSVHAPSDVPLAAVARAGRREINRAPRVLPLATPARFTLPEPPAERPAPRLPWLAMAGPLVAGVVLAFVMDPRFLLFSLLSPLMAGGQALSDRWHHKREKARTSTEHAQAVAARQAEIAEALTRETAQRREAAPDPAVVARLVAGPTPRLWERRPHDADWLRLRLGLAPLPVELTVEGGATPVVHDVPLTVDLTASPVLGIAGTVVTRRRVGAWLLAHAAALHSPHDLDIVVLAVDEIAWAWTRWLPHRVTEIDPSRRTLVLLDGARALRATPGVADLLRAALTGDGRLTVICLDERADDLPGECTSVAVVHDSAIPSVDLSVGGATPVRGALPDLVDDGWAERVSRSLASLVDATPQQGVAALPRSVAWQALPLTGDAAVDSEQLLAQWQRPTTRITLGVGEDGPWEVDLAADGPHALVAGTTGSGKSEALRSLVAGLAAANPPEALSFVLVDYKGGAAFGACAALPHVAGMVTDLDPALTERALVSLSAELRRRERLLRKAEVDDLRDYPGTAAGLEPLARLVIVVDEFATLAEELPDFVGGLVGIAQRGRSLGVHLVLATQRPEGCVSADIRANTALRICLSVTRDAESRDVVDAPDAALIPPGMPGRAFVRVGSAPLRAVQLARVTAPLAAQVIDGISVRPAGTAAPVAEVTDACTALDALVAACTSLQERGTVTRARSPWLAPLPHPIVGDGEAWAVADQPALQCYAAESFGLGDDGGHLAVLGAPRSGRTTAARAIIASLVGGWSADGLHVYGIDDSGALADLAELPHCGAVVRTHDVDRLVRLVGLLTSEVARRRDRGRVDDLPRLLLVVDKWESALDALEGRDGGRWVDALHALVADGMAAGLQVITVLGARAPSGRLASSIDRRLVLRMADPTDVTMFGVPLRSVPSELPPGRGFLCDASGFRLVQVVVPRPLPPLESASTTPPRRVDALPVSIDVVQAELLRRKPRPEGRACVLLGVGGDELAPVDLDVVDVSPAFVVAGPARSGRSTALARIAQGLIDEGVRVAAILPRQSPLAAVRGLVRLTGDEVAPPEDHVVVCDDVELASMGAQALLEAALLEARDGGPTVLLGGTTEDLLVGFRGPVVEARRSRCGLILAPRSPHDGELLGTRLPQPGSAEPPPGRGVLVLRGSITTVQVAT